MYLEHVQIHYRALLLQKTEKRIGRGVYTLSNMPCAHLCDYEADISAGGQWTRRVEENVCMVDREPRAGMIEQGVVTG